MAIIQEHFNVNGRDFIRTYSSDGREVVRDGISYSEACDPAEFNRTYIEGDLIPIDSSSLDGFLNTILTDGLVSMPSEDDPDYFSENEAEPNYFKED